MDKNKCEECNNEVLIDDEIYCNDCLDSSCCVRCGDSLSGFESVTCYNCSMHDEVNSEDYTSNEIMMYESMGYSLEDIKNELSKNEYINKDELNSYLLEKGYKEPVKEVSLIFGTSKGVGGVIMGNLHRSGKFIVSVGKSVPEQISAVLEDNEEFNELKEDDRDIYVYYYDDDLVQIHICGDLSEEKVIDDIEFIMKKYNLKIRNLINCQETIKHGGVESETIVDFRDVMEFNVNSNYNLILNLYPYMLDVKNSNIIIVSSIPSEIAGSSISYNVSKSAIDMLVKSLALDLSKYGIRINGISPDSCLKLNKTISDIKEDNFIVGYAYDVVDLVNYLINTSWATGENYTLEGRRLLK